MEVNLSLKMYVLVCLFVTFFFFSQKYHLSVASKIYHSGNKDIILIESLSLFYKKQLQSVMYVMTVC